MSSINIPERGLLCDGEYDVELEQLEGTECSRDSVRGGAACPVCAAAAVFPVNFALVETELIVGIPGTPEMLCVQLWTPQKTQPFVPSHRNATPPPIFPILPPTLYISLDVALHI